MDYFAGLDVSVKDTSVCIVDDAGRIVREVKVASEPAALLAVLRSLSYRFKRIGLEAGPLSQWLALAEAGLPVICVETRHMRAVLRARINKTDVYRIGCHRHDWRSRGGGSVCYRLVARQTMDNTRWNRGHTRRINDRRCSVDLTWLAISQAGVNDFIWRQYLHRSDD